MAGLMAAPMVLIELLLMGVMYKNKTANLAIMTASVMALIGFFALIRQQTAITDVQFLKSMIPHHSGAIPMCREAPIQDARIKELCGKIIDGQRKEIADMKAMLAERRQ